MADHEEDLQMALRMSMQNSPPEPKRSKPWENVAGEMTESSPEESHDVKNRRLQRELMAAAAEKRMMEAKKTAVVPIGTSGSGKGLVPKSQRSGDGSVPVEIEENLGEQLSAHEADDLFFMIFGGSTSREILSQWTNQGIRFSSDPETSMGLVQHEGGPCGVLAAIQAFVLKYLLFVQENPTNLSVKESDSSGQNLPKSEDVIPNRLASLTEDARKRALVRSMGEMLLRCGSNKRVVIATVNGLNLDLHGTIGGPTNEVIAKALDGLTIESASDMQKALRVSLFTSYDGALKRIESMIPVFQSRMGALLFLVSALLSRGLDSVQADRDDPSQPLVTAPFGHASQEIVNLLLCGEAVANVFDDRIDLGAGMFIKGVSTDVEVGFLTLLESLNFCKVGQHLKCPKWPIWVVGSESHYTVLFALDPIVQKGNEAEERESQIRRAFDAQDQSGGGGFIGVEGFQQVLKETNINLPSDKLDQLCSTGFIVWSEFWQLILDLDKNLGGLKDSTGLMGKKVFDLYHFNGIAKSVPNGNQGASDGEMPAQRPRLTKLRVSVPPRWTPEEYMADVAISSASSGTESGKGTAQGAESDSPMHAPLVDCIKTRWPRASCNWKGDAPSIV